MTDSARTRSEDRKLRGYGFHPDSNSPDSTRIPASRNPGREGKGKEFSSSHLQLEAWITEHTPGENHHAVSAAMLHLRRSGIPVSADSVRNFLRVRGWLREQREPRSAP